MCTDLGVSVGILSGGFYFLSKVRSRDISGNCGKHSFFQKLKAY